MGAMPDPLKWIKENAPAQVYKEISSTLVFANKSGIEPLELIKELLVRLGELQEDDEPMKVVEKVKEITDREIVLRAEEGRLQRLISDPDAEDFLETVKLEAIHQRERWGPEYDEKDNHDWFWMLGYLGGQALQSAAEDNKREALRRIVAMTASCMNWHAAVKGGG